MPPVAWGLVPDGVRALLVEAESKLMELKYRGARAGGASDLLGVSVLRADTHGDLMSVREAADTTSRAFAMGGEDFAYYLNESRAMQGLTAPAHRGHAPNDRGSRQSTTVQLPTTILRSMGVYLRYTGSVRADGCDMNQLLVAAWDGLRSRTAIGHWGKRGKGNGGCSVLVPLLAGVS